MQSSDIGQASFLLMEQFLVEARMTWYDSVKVKRIAPCEKNPSEYHVTYSSKEDSQYEETTTVEALDLMSYIALKSGIVTLPDAKKE